MKVIDALATRGLLWRAAPARRLAQARLNITATVAPMKAVPTSDGSDAVGTRKPRTLSTAR